MLVVDSVSFLAFALAGQRRGALVRSIGVVQAAAAACFLALLATPSQVAVAAGFFGIGLLSATPLLVGNQLAVAAVVMALVAGLPALLLFAVRL